MAAARPRLLALALGWHLIRRVDRLGADMSLENPRTRADWLTEFEIAKLRISFNAERSCADAADEVNCSVRVAQKYYCKFRGYPLARGRQKTVVAPPVERASRFYKSNFEL